MTSAGRQIPLVRVVLLIALTTLGFLPLHFVVPALPAIAQGLDCSARDAQLTITVYLVGIAIGQLCYGPLSDHFGRRHVLLAALLIFIASSLLAMTAVSIELLVALRFLQAIGACGAIMLGRAMVRDMTAGRHMVRQLALMTTFVSLLPVVAPFLAGKIVAFAGWRAIFGALAVMGMSVLAWIALAVEETRQTKPDPINLSGTLATYRRLWANQTFRRFALAGAFGTVSFYAFLTVSPFIFISVLGQSADTAGSLYMLIIAGITGGALTAHFTTRYLNPRRGSQIGLFISLAGASLMLASQLDGAISVTTIVASMIVFAFGAGMTSPFATAGSLSTDPGAVGAAAGLFGFVQQAFAALITMLASYWHDGTVLPVAVLMVSSTLLGLLSLRVRGRFVSKLVVRPVQP